MVASLCLTTTTDGSAVALSIDYSACRTSKWHSHHTTILITCTSKRDPNLYIKHIKMLKKLTKINSPPSMFFKTHNIAAFPKTTTILHLFSKNTQYSDIMFVLKQHMILRLYDEQTRWPLCMFARYSSYWKKHSPVSSEGSNGLVNKKLNR